MINEDHGSNVYVVKKSNEFVLVNVDMPFDLGGFEYFIGAQMVHNVSFAALSKEPHANIFVTNERKLRRISCMNPIVMDQQIAKTIDSS